MARSGGQQFHKGSGPGPFRHLQGLPHLTLGNQSLLQQAIGLGLGVRQSDFVVITQARPHRFPPLDRLKQMVDRPRSCPLLPIKFPQTG